MRPPLFRQPLLLLAAVLCAASLTACSTTPLGSTAKESPIQSAWVVLGEQAQAIARVVISDTVCPVLEQDGQAAIMQVRVAAATPALRPTVSKPEDSKPSAFPVLICEAPLRTPLTSASVAGIALPIPKATIQKIVVIGDTGCRLQSSSKYFQPCNDGAGWAFQSVAKAAAAFQPDLVIHVGDYHYRENACPPGLASCQDSPWGYGWDTWRADFFTPAQALLRAAPWVVVRGNHESCRRGGQGWWRLMDPRPFHTEQSCDLAQFDQIGDFSAPYAVPLGKIGGELAQLIVFDSSHVPNSALKKEDPAHAIYTEQFKAVDQLAATADFNLFINHHPVLGFSPYPNKDNNTNYSYGNLALQDIMRQSHPQRFFSDKVQATLSGHVHLFEALSFSSDHPTQFISGNGGSSLDESLPVTLPAGVTPALGANVAYFNNSNDVGYMTMERQGDLWDIQAWNLQGKMIEHCQMHKQTTTCTAIH